MGLHAKEIERKNGGMRLGRKGGGGAVGEIIIK